MTDLKDKLPNWLTPQIVVSFANFLAIVFTCGVVYNSTQRDILSNRQDITELKAEVRLLREQNTSIAVLKADVAAIKESSNRIEARIDRLQPTK